MRTFPIVSAVFLYGVAGCGGDGPAVADGRTPEPTVRDSAGVRIVESVPDGLPVWTTDPEPVLSIGALDGSDAETLYQVNDVERRSDGSWLVANGSTEEVRVFDADGAYVRTIGRRGEGPGEFVALSRLFVLPADSLAVYDSRQRRVSVFDADGALVREVTFEALPEGTVTPFGRLESGGWGVRRSDGSYSTGGTGRGYEARSTEFHAIAAPDGSAPSVFAELPGDLGWVVQAADFVSFRDVPFGPDNAMEVLGDRFVGGVTEHPEVRLWDASGTEVERWRILEAAAPLTEGAWNEVRRQEEAELTEVEGDFPPGFLEAGESFWIEVDRPQVRPHWQLLRTAATGETWVREHVERFDASRRWRVFDASGSLTRAVHLPDGFELHWIGRDLVAGVVTDEFEVEYVRVYRLVSPP